MAPCSIEALGVGGWNPGLLATTGELSLSYMKLAMTMGLYSITGTGTRERAFEPVFAPTWRAGRFCAGSPRQDRLALLARASL